LFLSSRSVLVRNQHHNHGDNRQSAQKVQAQMTAENKPRAQGKCNLGTGILIGHAFVMQYFALILFSSRFSERRTFCVRGWAGAKL
jgi:hypothetical protein